MQNIQQSYVKAAQEKEMRSPFKYESILNTVIYFVSEDDFKRCTVLQEKKVVEDENQSSQIERLLDDLGEWAEVDRNLVLAKIQKDDLKNVETVIGKIVGILAEQ